MSNASPRSWERNALGDASRRQRQRLNRLRPAMESLEDRKVPAMSVDFAAAIAVSGSGSVDVESKAVFNDASGNVYITGSLQGTADFDPSNGVSNLTSTGGRDAFLAKYSSTGTLLWAKDIRGADSTSVAQGSAIAVDSSGNVIVTGTFTGGFNFDPSTGNTSLGAGSRNDVYIAKYSSSGVLAWARQVVGSGSSFDQGYAVAVDGSGNIAVGGTFQGTATFGSTSVTAGGSSDSFVSKLDTNGGFLWTRVTTGSGSSIAQTSGLTFDALNNLVLTGFYAGTVDFDPTNTLLTLPVYGSRDIFVQKFDGTGSLAWTKAIGGTDIDQGGGVAADSSGNVYLTGTFSSTADFDPSASVVNLTAGGFEDAFVLKLSSSGSYVWVKDLSTTGYNAAQGTGIVLDNSGHVFVSGYYQGTMTLASGQTLTSAGSYDVFLGEYDTSGNYVAGQSYGGTNFDAAFGIGVNAAGKVAIAGRYSGPATFGSFTLAAQSSKSIFVAQVSTASVVVPGPPSAPNAPTLQASSDSGSSNSDNITNAASPVFNVTGVVVGNTLQLLRDGVVVATRSGPGAIIDPGPITDGNHLYTAIQVDTSSQSSPSSSATTVKFDKVAPSAPTSPTLFSGDDSGAVGDRITNVKQPRLTGTAETGSTVQILNASNTVIATGTADPITGAYTLKPTSILADGVFVVRATASDVAGNTSTASATFTLTIDSAAPAAPTSPTLVSADDTGVLGDGVTNVKQPRLTGTAETGSIVQILSATNTVIAYGTADPATGVYTLKPSSNLSDGTYLVRAQATDTAGNLGAAGATFTLTIDTVVPATPNAPTLDAADDSGTSGDNLTNVAGPRMTGTAAGAAGVQFLNGSGAVIGTGSVSNNIYRVALSSALSDGVSTIRVQVFDIAGNLSSPSAGLTITIDTQAPVTPAAPTLLTADDSGAAGDGITNVTQPRFVGTTEPYSTIQLTASNVVVGTASAGSDGSYSVKPANPITNLISAIRVRAIDAAGNVSVASPSFTLYVDTTAPAAPSTPALLPSDDSGAAGDGVTSVRQPTLTGTAENGGTVRLLDANGNILGTATGSGSSYAVKIASSLADGVYAIRAQATDVAGNTGAASSPFSLSIFNAPPLLATPSTPTLLPADDSGARGDNLTNVNNPRLIGTATAGTTIQIINGSGTVLGSAVVGGNGAYTVAFSSAIPDGAITLRTRIVDSNSNTSNASGSLALTIDTVIPATPGAPTLLSADDTGVKGDGITAINPPRISSTGVAGTTVTLVNGSGTTIAYATVPQGGTFNLTPIAPLADGNYALRLLLTDAAGNASALSTVLNLTIDTTVPNTPTTPGLYPTDDTGTVGDGITSIAQPRLWTTAEAGLSVTFVTDTGTVLATGTATNTGAVLLQTNSRLADGTYTVRAVAADAAGNTSLNSATLIFTIFTAIPPSPPAPLLNPADDTGVAGDSKTSNRQPRFIGTTLPGVLVELRNAANAVIGTTTSSSADGSYSVQPTTNLAAGSYSLSIRVRNVAGTTAVSTGPYNVSIIDATAADFDGDGKSDLGIFRQATAQWIVSYSGGSGSLVNQFGATNLYDIPVSGDFDGTGKVVQGVFRPSTGQWFINSPTGQRIVSFGATNLLDIPVPGDYDGVGYTQIAVYRPSTAQWFVLGANGYGHLLGVFGATGNDDIPVPGDYDGSGKTEMAVFRTSTAQWFYQSANGGKLLGVFGATGGIDVPVPGDYLGLGQTQMAVFRPSTAQWFVNTPNGGRLFANYGDTKFADIPLQTPSGFLKKVGLIKGPTVSSLVAPSAMTVQPMAAIPAKSVSPSTSAHPSTPSNAQAPARASTAAAVSRPQVVVNYGELATAKAHRFWRRALA